MSAAVWSELENDPEELDLWRGYLHRVRNGGSDPLILELGAGTGRLCVPLSDHAWMIGLENDVEELQALRQARRESLQGHRITTVLGDARHFELNRRVDAVFATAQFVQMVSPEDRVDVLRCAARHLYPGALLVLTYHPDMREALFDADEPQDADCEVIDGRLHASRPISARLEGDVVQITRERSIDGVGERERVTIDYHPVDYGELVACAEREGLRLVERRLLDGGEYLDTMALSFRRESA